VVGYGRSCPSGRLPVFSVDTEQEAIALLTLACPTNMNGEFIAPELAYEQTLENLDKFSDRLEKCHQVIKQRKRKQ